MRRQLSIVAALLALAGCPTRDKYDPMPAVRITSPAVAKTYTNGTVRITASIEPALGLPVVLLDDGAPLTTLAPPAYSFDWVTAGAVEGVHSIVAVVALSSGDVTSEPVTIVVDRTPPAVAAQTPAPGATGVMLRSPIRLTFSEPVLLSQPADATVSMSAGGAGTVATHAALDAQGETLTIALDDLADLPLPSTLAAAIVGSITDRAGNPLARPAGDWTWQVPDLVKLPALPGCPTVSSLQHLPMFAVGSDLKPVAAWASATGGATAACQLAVSRRDDGRWIQLAPPSPDPSSAALGATLALGPSDDPIVAWRPSLAADPGEIDVASIVGAGWQPLQALTPQPGLSFPVVYPLLRVDPSGEPILLWGAGASADRYFLARLSGTAWRQDFGTIPIGNDAPFDGTHFDMIVDADGSPIVSYIASSTGHVSRWDGGGWSSAPEVLAMPEPFLAFDSAHRPMVVTTAPGSFFVQRLIDGAWQPMSSAAVPPQARHPHLGAGPDGLPIVIWYDAQTSSVGLARWTAQQHWDTRAAFAFGPDARDEPPQLVVDRQGTAWVGWRDGGGQFNLWMTNF